MDIHLDRFRRSGWSCTLHKRIYWFLVFSPLRQELLSILISFSSRMFAKESTNMLICIPSHSGSNYTEDFGLKLSIIFSSRSRPISTFCSGGPKENRSQWVREDFERVLPGFTSKKVPGTVITLCFSASLKNPKQSFKGGGSPATDPHT